MIRGEEGALSRSSQKNGVRILRRMASADGNVRNTVLASMVCTALSKVMKYKSVGVQPENPRARLGTGGVDKRGDAPLCGGVDEGRGSRYYFLKSILKKTLNQLGASLWP